MSIEEKINKLDEFVELLKNDELPLEKAMQYYNDALVLSNEIQTELTKTKEKIKKLEFANLHPIDVNKAQDKAAKIEINDEMISDFEEEKTLDKE